MPSALRDPKTLPEWIELDYFKRPRPFRRSKRWLFWGTFLFAVAIVTWTIFFPSAHAVYEAGPVSQAHRMFGDQCERCHTDSFQPLYRLVFADSHVHSVSNDACRGCHAGPVHHGNAMPARLQDCAGCHREHRSEPVLAKVADGQCVACHGNLETVDGKLNYHAKITNWNVDHPPFGQWRGQALQDPGTIRFSHKAHLVPGGVLNIDPVQREKQGGGGKAPPDSTKPSVPHSRVVLECQSCHVPDEAGRYMKPIQYEAHCQTCHPLLVQVVDDRKPDKVGEAALVFSKTPVPHPKSGQGANAVRAAVRERLTELAHAAGGGLGGDEAAFASPVPGRRGQPVTLSQRDWVDRQLGHAERLLFDGAGGCQYCHQETSNPEKRPKGLPEYRLSPDWTARAQGFPMRWFPHSVFGHASHRMLACGECHAAATSDKATDVLMPAIDNCRSCHNAQAGARSDCAECHTYHSAEGKQQFRGLLTIDQFRPRRRSD